MCGPYDDDDSIIYRLNGLEMVDLIYIAGTLAFFALAIAYIAFCEGLGGPSGEETP